MSDLAPQWSERVVAWRTSGMSVAAWCRQNAEGYHRFLYWRKRLDAQGQSHPVREPGGFIELRPARSALHLECNGIHIHVDRDFDSGLLADILTVLKRV